MREIIESMDTTIRTGPGEKDRTDLRETLQNIARDLEHWIGEIAGSKRPAASANNRKATAPIQPRPTAQPNEERSRGESAA